MLIRQSVKIGFLELRSNKLGSFLTMLGVIFGVAAVIASVAIGEGAKQQAMEQVSQLGINNLRISPLELEGQEKVTATQQNPDGLAKTDIDAIAANCPFVQRMAPVMKLKQKPYFQGRLINASVLAVTADYQIVMNFHPTKGRFISDMDNETAQRVCIIGAEIYQEIFGNDPWEKVAGNWIQISDSMFTVAGVMEDKRLASARTSAVNIRNVNRDIYLPLSAAEKRFTTDDNKQELSELIIQIKSRNNVKQAAEMINKVLDRTHSSVVDYEMVIPLDLLRQAQATQRRFNLVLAAIAAISLLVGGIGIMNIMLAGVTQRTREIGIRRALGATRRDILTQFLMEAVILSLLGGIIGIVAGLILGGAISYYAGWSTIFSIKAIVLSVMVSAGVGVVAGLIPARRAAALHPIEALRYE